MTTLVTMNEADARALTERIRASAETLWELLLESHDREAWRVLGYGSWREYAAVEFQLSKVQAYYLLNQGRVVRAITAAAGSDEFNALNKITIRTATDLRPHIDEAAAEIRQRVDSGEEPESVVSDVVDKYRKPQPEREAAGRRQTVAKPTSDVLSNVVHSLHAATIAIRTLNANDLPDDAPADRWIKEIDKTVSELRSFRKQIRSRYGIS